MNESVFEFDFLLLEEARDMPRGFRQGEFDRKVTKLLRENGLFVDRRSKVVHDLQDNTHLLLFGQDMSNQRVRMQQKGLQKGINDELHHKKHGLTGRCDCQDNLEFLSAATHRKVHNREPKFNEVKIQKEGTHASDH